jgi:ribosomal protein L11 methyltransferase
VDLVVAELWDHGTLGIETVEGGDVQQLLAYFESPPSERFLGLLSSLALAYPEAVPVAAVDWVARFREGFRGFAVGRFQIVPEWEERPQLPTPRLSLVVDPSGAFGTGTHESTRLCLLALERLINPSSRVLDLGTGSGILSVAAQKLGCSFVAAVDNDPVAAREAVRHGHLNDVCLPVSCGDLGRHVRSHFDIVIANIQAPLLVARAGELNALVTSPGMLLLSGLLESDIPEVERAYSGRGAIRVSRDGEWVALEISIP